MLIFFVGLKKKGTFIPPHGGYPTTRDPHSLFTGTNQGRREGRYTIPCLHEQSDVLSLNKPKGSCLHEPFLRITYFLFDLYRHYRL